MESKGFGKKLATCFKKESQPGDSQHFIGKMNFSIPFELSKDSTSLMVAFYI